MIVELDSAGAIYVRLDWLKHKQRKSLQGLLNKSNLNIKVKDDACVLVFAAKWGPQSRHYRPHVSDGPHKDRNTFVCSITTFDTI